MPLPWLRSRMRSRIGTKGKPPLLMLGANTFHMFPLPFPPLVSQGCRENGEESNLAEICFWRKNAWVFNETSEPYKFKPLKVASVIQEAQ